MNLRPLISLVFAIVLVACAELRDEPVVSPEPAAQETQSIESQRLQRYYGKVQDKLVAQGLLRTDGGGPDVPFSSRNLVDNFERIALYDEYVVRNGRFVAQQTPSRLRRWESPIRIGLIFGASVSASQRSRDTTSVTKFAARLARLTGLTIVMDNKKPNFLVLFMNHDEQSTAGAALRKHLPRIDALVVKEIQKSPRNTFCAAYAFSDSLQSSAYSAAIILVKAEHKDLMRRSCIHEEMAQAMGLANDSALARPSIFNDDEEFALLTYHDELLLRILYDRRLRLGMTPETARPHVERVARELLGGNS